jgi:hypothetical protein
MKLRHLLQGLVLVMKNKIFSNVNQVLSKVRDKKVLQSN